MMKLFKNEDAFTGLEAAIVLIAFVVVAAVFSYVMLGAGFFATQEAQQVVHTGSQQASSSLEIIGNIYGRATSSGSELGSIEFTVGNTAGGTPIDISQMLVTFTSGTVSEVITYDKDSSVVSGGSGTPSTPSAGTWAVNNTYNDIGDTKNHLLEPGEQFVLKIVFPDTVELKPNTPFSVNLQPAVGAVYPIKKTVPAYLNTVNTL
ncbi:archaellin/type IV pilin N-terminal domain-containing protein [Methanoculleus sp. UBA430]|uniref:archaellin/type IV pilin N-terminal domain-containing protein n=1 Tax=Methanoculleus sp. UBA430 TaxID=1915511 RepID=UPI0025DA0A49|nr:archaellin/type IV pilin N-terminal domain-containing protein [Methanoculleus sp. UBA430]